jgi:hypothetical protein
VWCWCGAGVVLVWCWCGELWSAVTWWCRGGAVVLLCPLTSPPECVHACARACVPWHLLRCICRRTRIKWSTFRKCGICWRTVCRVECACLGMGRCWWETRVSEPLLTPPLSKWLRCRRACRWVKWVAVRLGHSTPGLCVTLKRRRQQVGVPPAFPRVAFSLAPTVLSLACAGGCAPTVQCACARPAWRFPPLSGACGAF